jgi:chromosome partitioning protein
MENKTMKIAFFNNKGGVGKTTSVINVAYALSNSKQKVLVIDCDKQLNAFRFFAENAHFKTTIQPTRYERLEICSYDKKRESSQEFREYDYVIFDLPPALSEVTRNILKLADYVFVPIDISTFSLQGLPKVTEEISASGVKLGGVFISMLESKSSRTKAQNDIIETITTLLGDKLLETTIPRNNTAQVSIVYRETVFERMHWGSASQAFGALTEEIVGRCAE